jgi:hypothetical protein
MNQEKINVISLGAGKQSSYMLLNALENKFKYKPDIAIFSDTGCEPQYVYDYLDWLTYYVKDKYNFIIIKVKRGNLMQDMIDYINGKRSRASSLPFFSENGAPIMRQCTLDYKIQPLRKYIQKIRGRSNVRLWIGISLDEIQRIKNSPAKYIEHYYSLVENRISIDSIVNWFGENNLQEPGKSACFICPFHSHKYWQRFKRESPTEFNLACEFDDKIRQLPNMKTKTYLYRGLKPLREVNFDYEPTLFPELIEECYGMCGL